jgi:hypothetical protein
MSVNPVIVRGLDINLKLVFELRWVSGHLVRTGPSDVSSTRLLWFLDPASETEERLWALPVLKDFEISDDDGRFTLEGLIRSFLPEVDNGATAVEFEIEIEPRSSAPFARLKKCEIGRTKSSAPIPLSVDGLRQASLTFSFRGNPPAPKYLHETLLHIRPAPAIIASKLEWRAAAAFVEAPEDRASKEKPHARFVLERSADVAIDDGAQALAPFALDFKGIELPANSDAGEVVRRMVMRQRLPWEDAWTTTGATTHWLLRFDVPQAAVFRTWDTRVVAPVQSAIDLVDAGRPLTTLPTLNNLANAGPVLWDAWWTFIDRVADEDIDRSDYRAGSLTSTGLNNTVTIIARRVTPVAVKTNRPRADVEFASIFRTNGGALSVECSCHPIALDNELTPATDEGAGITFRLEQVKPALPATPPPAPPAGQPVRFGALDLQLLPEHRAKDDKDDTIKDLIFDEAANACAAWLAYDETKPFVVRGVRFRSGRIVLGVAAISPGSQDDTIGEEYADAVLGEEDLVQYRRDRPLVLALDRQTGQPWTARYRLHMTEVLAAGESQTIAFTLREIRTTTTAASPRAIVLDAEPWLVALVEPPLLSAGTDAETTEIGNWSNRASTGAAWELRSDNRGFTLVLPPQGLGEAMHRRREDRDIEPGKPIDFRFTPPARLQLRTPRVEQRFVEPAWNLRRLAEAREGVGVIEARFELLYGLSARVRPAAVQVTELAARLGDWPGTPPRALPWPHTEADRILYAHSRKLWLELRKIVRTRLAVLETWSPRQAQLLLTEADGLRVRLRDSARLHYPLPGKPDALPSTGAPPPYFPPEGGLKGGWSWGFESRNVLNAVARTPDSHAASLSDVYFSSMGGWGQQRAVFDRGLSAVIARVEMGRASSINIERLGRIGVFWNKAKHVIVYERTVAASRQFFGEQHPLTGSPVLRKVDEYIEILETERAFPERDAPPASRGFVLGCQFADGQPPRIRVNSRWGRDLGSIGWMVPLWTRGAAPADVYPKPTIHLQAAGVSADDKVLLAIDDPDKLCFFTSTDPAWGIDSDTWPAVESVDFQAIDPAWLKPKTAAPSSADPAQFNAPDSPISTGVGAFTLRLQPAPGPVNYVAARTTAEIVRALPRNLTLMRGAIVEPRGETAEGAALRDLRAGVENAFSAFLAASPQADFTKAAKAFRDEMARAETAYGTIAAAIGSGAICDHLAAHARAQFTNFATQTRIEALAALHQIEGGFREAARDLFPATEIGPLREALRELLRDIIGIAGGATGALRTVRGMPGEVLLAIRALGDDLRGLNVEIDAAFRDAERAIAALKDWSTVTNPGEKAALVARARQALSALAAAAAGFLERGGIDQRIADAVRGWIGAMLDPVRIALDLGRNACNDALRKLSGELDTLTQSAALGRLRDAAGAAFGTILDTIDKIEDEWQPLFEGEPDAEWPLDEALESVRKELGKAIDALAAPTYKALEEAIDGVTGRLYTAIDQQLDTLIARTVEAAPFSALLASACKSLIAQLSEIDAYVKRLFRADLIDSLRAQLEGLSAADLHREIDRLLSGVLDALSGFVARARVTFPELPALPRLAPDDALRLLRSFGDVPQLPNLSFQLPQVGYYFFSLPPVGQLPQLLPAIDLSSVAAYANKLGASVLNGVDSALPTRGLLDRLLPAEMIDFDLSKVFKNCAGLRLDGLFRHQRMSAAANQGLRVTHGVDENSRSGWLQVDADVPFQQPITMLDIAGLRLDIGRARFRATARVDAQLGEPPRQRTRGSIRGDWQLSAGGRPLVELYDSTLEFDEGGRITFDVTPARVRLKPPLDFLSRILEPFSSSKSGLRVAVTPTGVVTTLALPIPNVQAGSFGIANLSLGLMFAVDISPQFRLRAAVAIADEDRPFTLTVFVLGGAGHFRTSLMYRPSDGLFTTEVSIAIYASASLAISLGVVSGGIYAYFGVAVTYVATNQSGGSLTVTLRILFVGEVCLLGFLSIGLTLGLEASYGDDNDLIGRGFVRCSIKIGWFITINVDAAVQYSFGKGTSSSQSSSDIQTAADNYVDLF